MKLISGIIVAVIFAVMTFGIWGYLNRPESEPPWPAHIQGVAFSPYAADQNPFGSKDEVASYKLSEAIRIAWLEDGDDVR